MKVIDMIAWILLIIGGLNWGLIGLANMNAVDAVLGVGSAASMWFDVLVGVAAIYAIFRWCSCCGSSCKK